ncbi:MAG: c-type cytochrome [Planctomycetes bacterium]|nr:c-type cytochrome [Planctomycetota bacterium]
MRHFGVALVALIFPSLVSANDLDEAAKRGRDALLTRAFNPPVWSMFGYDSVWKYWQPALKEAPKEYDESLREHYGFHAAPYENGRLPMGLRESRGFFGKGITTDCMLCHAGSIMGKSYVGLGNASLDVHAFFEDFNRTLGTSGRLPFTFSNARGTSEAAGMAVYLLEHREPDLKLRFKKHDFGLRDDLCEDVPAWWLLKKKKTMYYTGTSHARSVRSIMQFMLVPGNGLAQFEKEEATFADIQAYLLSLEAPKYLFPIDKNLAETGQKIFNNTCARCHGTYGEKWTYPNKIIPIDEIGTDRNRFDGLSRSLGEFYNKSWFGQEKEYGPVSEPKGYQAPPLDGIWATAPYFHNGSVPTLAGVLNSKSRPKIFTRSFKTDEEAYDKVNIGWKVQILDNAPDQTLPAYERRKTYDTTQPGRSNQGHTFGDDLTDEQRRAVIEYLKTL